jgi:HSP20 family molecular chaperone IbpA
MKRSIPPRTMGDVSRLQRKRKSTGKGIQLPSSFSLGLHFGKGQHVPPNQARSLAETFPTGLFKKPRNWTFQTKPLFKKIKGPLVDVFHEAEEVLIVIDLGGFQRGDISLNMKQEEYSIIAKRGDQEFREAIALPPEVDIGKVSEHFRNGVLEIVLPRKKKANSSNNPGR